MHSTNIAWDRVHPGHIGSLIIGQEQALVDTARKKYKLVNPYSVRKFLDCLCIEHRTCSLDLALVADNIHRRNTVCFLSKFISKIIAHHVPYHIAKWCYLCVLVGVLLCPYKSGLFVNPPHIEHLRSYLD